MRRALVACVVVAACGDNQQPVEVVVPHGTPAFVAYKANGTWRIPPATAHGYRVDAQAPYQFVFVCADDQGFDVEELFADPSDGDQELQAQSTIGACRVDLGNPAIAEATGSVVQPGFLELGGLTNASGDSPDWTYDLATTPGPHALAFRPITADVVVIRRALELGAGTNPQPVIDATTEAMPLARAALTISGMVDGEPVATTTTLATSAGESLVIAIADASPLLLRTSDLEADERQWVDVYIQEPTPDGSYTDHATLDATDLAVKLQPPPDVSYATSELGTSVTWQGEPLDAVGYELLVANSGIPSLIHGVATATVSGDSTLDLSVDGDAPGFLDAWRPLWSHDLASSSRAFQLAASRDGACYETLLVDRGRSTSYTAPGSRCPVLR
jgi:hypothetical protein